MIQRDETYELLKDVALEVSEYFIASGKTLSVGESFTGGAISESLVSIPGASTYLREDIVCYSNAAKEYRLNVEKSTIERYGAVSEKVVREMIKGLMNSQLKPDFALATTGNAGPGVEDKSERGVCYAAVGYGENIIVKRFILAGDRRENIAEGTLIALQILLDVINKTKEVK